MLHFDGRRSSGRPGSCRRCGRCTLSATCDGAWCMARGMLHAAERHRLGGWGQCQRTSATWALRTYVMSRKRL
jgi:hypothetical protein